MSVPNVPDPGTPPLRPPLGVVRGIVAAVGIIVMLLSGGCSLLLGGPLLTGSDPEGLLGTVLVIGGIPFAVGALITWLALKAGR